jgi:Ni,Fe-hydrogenase III large subunit
VDITSQNSDDIIAYATSRDRKKTAKSRIIKKIEQMRNQLEKISNARDATNMFARRVKNM